MVRLKAVASAALLTPLTSTSMTSVPFAQAPLLKALKRRLLNTTCAPAAPVRGTRTTMPCAPPFWKKCCTA